MADEQPTWQTQYATAKANNDTGAQERLLRQRQNYLVGRDVPAEREQLTYVQNELSSLYGPVSSR